MPQNEYDSLFANVLKPGGAQPEAKSVPEPAPVTESPAEKPVERPVENVETKRPAAPSAPTPKPAVPNYASQTRREADSGTPQSLDGKLEALRQDVRPGSDSDIYASTKPVKVMLPEGLVKLVLAQMPGGTNIKTAVAAYLYLHLTTKNSNVGIPDDVRALVDGLHLDTGLDGVIDVLADMNRELRLVNKKLREVMRRNIELEQLAAWLVLERKDMVQSRTEPVEAMDFQSPDITSLIRQTEVDAAARIKKQERAEGVQIDKHRGSVE